MDTQPGTTSNSGAPQSPAAPAATPQATATPSQPRPSKRPSRCYSIDAVYGQQPQAADPYPGMTGLSTIMSEIPTDAAGDTSFPPSSPPPQTTSPPPTNRARSRSRSHSASVSLPRRPYRRMSRDVEAEAGSGGARSPNRLRSGSDSHQSVSVRMSSDSHGPNDADSDSLNDEMVGVLDCVDPEVGTVNHLQNMTNGIMFPHIPGLWNRRVNVTLPSNADESDDSLPLHVSGSAGSGDDEPAKPARARAGTLSRVFGKGQKDAIKPEPLLKPQQTESHVMTDIVHDKLDAELDSETDEIAKEHDLDKHLKKVLARKKRNQKIKASLRGLWAYLKTPMGIIVAIYGFLVVFWGAAIVIFLAGWIPTSSKDVKDKWVEITSQIVNGLFTVTGVGLIPWRVIDTYRISVIWQYRKKVEKRRKKLGLPPIENYDDLPDPETIPGYQRVLTPEEEKRLKRNQDKFSASQTWYKPHATATHTAFPMAIALWNTILMDGNSFFQCFLCGTMWGMNRHKRPAWTTATLIPLSFLCGIGAAVLIWQGGKRSKKTKQVEDKLRKALGVDEKVEPEVKHPRRATVGPSSAPPMLDLPRRQKRSASIDVASDPAEVECFNRQHGDHGLVGDSLKHNQLDVVAEDDGESKEIREATEIPTLPRERQRSF